MGQKSFANQHRHMPWLDLKAAACLVRYSSRLDGSQVLEKRQKKSSTGLHIFVVRLRVIVSLARDLFSQLALGNSELMIGPNASAFALNCNKNNSSGPYYRIWMNLLVIFTFGPKLESAAGS